MARNQFVFTESELVVVDRVRTDLFKTLDVIAQLRGFNPGSVAGFTDDGKGFVTKYALGGGGDGGDKEAEQSQ